MAGVTIPFLKKIQSSTAQAPNRLNVRVADQSESITSRTNAIADLTNEGIGLFTDIEDTKVDQQSKEAELEFDLFQTEELQKLRNVKGDPTGAYNQYELDATEKVDEILNKNPNSSERIKRNVARNFSKVEDASRVQILKQHGLQQEIYDQNLFEANLKLKQNKLPIFAGDVREGDQSSFNRFDQGVVDIRTDIAKRSVVNGTAEKLEDDDTSKATITYLDNEGKEVRVKMLPQAKARVVKELSSAITNSIKILIDSGKVNEAKMIRERYKEFIDPLNQARLTKLLEKSEKDRKAADLARDIVKLPPNQQAAAIQKVSDRDSLLGREVLGIVSADTNRRNSNRRDKQNKNFDGLLGKVNQMRNAGTLHGISDLKATQEYKSMYPNLSAIQQQSIDETVTSPKKSDPKRLTRAYDILLGNDPTLNPLTLTGTQITEIVTGLSATDKTRMSNKFLSRQKNSSKITDVLFNRAAKRLKSRLVAMEILELDEFGRGIDDDSEKLLQVAYDDLINQIDSLPKNPTTQELNNWITDYIKDAKQRQIFGGGGILSAIGDFFTGGDDDDEPSTTTKKQITNSVNPFIRMEPKRRFNFQKQYKREFGLERAPSVNDPKFQNWVREQIK